MLHLVDAPLLFVSLDKLVDLEGFPHPLVAVTLVHTSIPGKPPLASFLPCTRPHVERILCVINDVNLDLVTLLVKRLRPGQEISVIAGVSMSLITDLTSDLG